MDRLPNEHLAVPSTSRRKLSAPQLSGPGSDAHQNSRQLLSVSGECSSWQQSHNGSCREDHISYQNRSSLGPPVRAYNCCVNGSSSPQPIYGCLDSYQNPGPSWGIDQSRIMRAEPCHRGSSCRDLNSRPVETAANRRRHASAVAAVGMEPDRWRRFSAASASRTEGEARPPSAESVFEGDLESLGEEQEEDEEYTYLEAGPDYSGCSHMDKVLYSTPEEARLKRRLKFHFLNPWEKWEATGRLPWKLLLQLLKIILVTSQLIMFGNYRYAHAHYYEDQTAVFHHFFIKDWHDWLAPGSAAGRPTQALYTRTHLYEALDFIVQGYKTIESEALSPIFVNSSLRICQDHVRKAASHPDSAIETRCRELTASQLQQISSIREEINLPRLLQATVFFNLTSLRLQPLAASSFPACFQFRLAIRVDNSGQSAQFPILLEVSPVRLACSSQVVTNSASSYSQLVLGLNLSTMCVSCASLLLCIRALIRAQILKHEVESFFRRTYGWSLTQAENLEFLNLWYVMMVGNDILVIAGCGLKQLMESQVGEEELWDICSLLLGTANILVWLSLLRYLGFFQPYNVLILTLKGAAPNILRFLVCASLIFFGFMLAGWLVLGPYHPKFSSLASSAECLFSLLNGDDMFVTFSSFPVEKSWMVWVYCQAYLYLFSSLFIYVVLSLFISVIMDTYEMVKHCYDRGFRATRLEQFYCSSEFDFKSRGYPRESSVGRLVVLLRNKWYASRHGYEQI